MQLVLRAAAAYMILLFAVRLVGRRTASQMAPFDLVVLFLFAGITITPVLADDHSMTGAFSAICTIGLMHIAVSWMKMHSDRFGRIVDGTPVVVFENGDFNRRRMRRLRLTQQDIMAAARQRGLMRLDQVRYAVAERDGKISIVEDEA
nr:YetF domain-containing protein [uncultured Rhodopila sp.]